MKDTSEMDAISIIILLRVLPFVPSGLVTLNAALSKIRILPFCIASTIGKVPALITEAYTVVYVLESKTELRLGLIVLVIILFLLYLLCKRYKKTEKN